MNIHANIVNQQVQGLIEKNPDIFPGSDSAKNASKAFLLLCLIHYFDISLQSALDLVTDGGNDAGIDAIHIGSVEDGEFLVTIFQSKYKHSSQDGIANFPENAIKLAIQTAEILLDPKKELSPNSKVRAKIEEVRSLLVDGYIPHVCFVFCNNGQIWTNTAQQYIDQLKAEYPETIEFKHFNHDSIIRIVQSIKKINTKIQFSGKIIAEDMNYIRILIGRIHVSQIADLFNEFGELLLQRNIRRYLGLYNNRINYDIYKTLCSNKSDRFYFYNNGITILCDNFEYNAFQKQDNLVTLKNMQIINGGQTCKTIYETIQKEKNLEIDSAYVLVRIYQISEDEKDFAQEITYATNSQTPVDLRDLRSNDTYQKNLELGMKELGYIYERKRRGGKLSSKAYRPEEIAEAVLAVWRQKPQQARCMRQEFFNKLYEAIFSDLNAAQALLALKIFRFVEEKRKAAEAKQTERCISYASQYLAMLVGHFLCPHSAIDRITLTTYTKYEQEFLALRETFYAKAVAMLQDALKKCYGNRQISYQQLAGTFRRGDLLEILFEKNQQ